MTPLIVILLGITVVGSFYTASYLPEERKYWETGALAAERDALQTAMSAMMMYRNLTTVNEHTTGQAVNDWTAFPTGTGVVPLANIYVDLATSLHYYCWDARGEMNPRSDDPDVAEKPGECPG